GRAPRGRRLDRRSVPEIPCIAERASLRIVRADAHADRRTVDPLDGREGCDYGRLVIQRGDFEPRGWQVAVRTEPLFGRPISQFVQPGSGGAGCWRPDRGV